MYFSLLPPPGPGDAPPPEQDSRPFPARAVKLGRLRAESPPSDLKLRSGRSPGGARTIIPLLNISWLNCALAPAITRPQRSEVTGQLRGGKFLLVPGGPLVTEPPRYF